MDELDAFCVRFLSPLSSSGNDFVCNEYLETAGSMSVSRNVKVSFFLWKKSVFASTFKLCMKSAYCESDSIHIYTIFSVLGLVIFGQLAKMLIDELFMIFRMKKGSQRLDANWANRSNDLR